MDVTELDQLKECLRKLPPEDQDHMAGFLLVERLKRNSLVMPALHKRVEDSDPENWQTLKSLKEARDND
ncbi:MAG: hypothetical protein P8P36_05365 [Akkermansiaceae bacterium]|nr:hypothetical protein [Akkermansiaceae bacterium]